LYGELCSFRNLELAYRKARKGKRSKSAVQEFEYNLEGNLFQLKRELETFAYEPKPLRVFAIRDPKTRLISAPHFRDRIVHHALCNVIEPIFDRMFIHDSYASRKGKGTHSALRRFDKFKRRASRNGRLLNGARDNSMVCGYVLKCDIRHYFASVDHEMLLRIIDRKVRDEKVMQLISKILSRYAPAGKGMPIGALTSQLFANIYLNELDYFVKHALRAKHYVRYMDDFMLLHESAKHLREWQTVIGSFLKSELKLELHREKTKVFPLHNGVGMLGYRIFYHYKLLKKSNMHAISKKISTMSAQSAESWMAHARCAETYKLRRYLAAHANGLHGSG
jgi:retron-type reverse transcriptase